MKLVARSKDDGREKEVEEELVVETNSVLNGSSWRQSYNQAHHHAWPWRLLVDRRVE